MLYKVRKERKGRKGSPILRAWVANYNAAFDHLGRSETKQKL